MPLERRAKPHEACVVGQCPEDDALRIAEVQDHRGQLLAAHVKR